MKDKRIVGILLSFAYNLRPLKNLTIFVTLPKRVGFSEGKHILVTKI